MDVSTALNHLERPPSRSREELYLRAERPSGETPSSREVVCRVSQLIKGLDQLLVACRGPAVENELYLENQTLKTLVRDVHVAHQQGSIGSEQFARFHTGRREQQRPESLGVAPSTSFIRGDDSVRRRGSGAPDFSQLQEQDELLSDDYRRWLEEAYDSPQSSRPSSRPAAFRRPHQHIDHAFEPYRHQGASTPGSHSNPRPSSFPSAPGQLHTSYNQQQQQQPSFDVPQGRMSSPGFKPQWPTAASHPGATPRPTWSHAAPGSVINHTSESSSSSSRPHASSSASAAGYGGRPPTNPPGGGGGATKSSSPPPPPPPRYYDQLNSNQQQQEATGNKSDKKRGGEYNGSGEAATYYESFAAAGRA